MSIAPGDKGEEMMKWALSELTELRAATAFFIFFNVMCSSNAIAKKSDVRLSHYAYLLHINLMKTNITLYFNEIMKCFSHCLQEQERVPEEGSSFQIMDGCLKASQSVSSSSTRPLLTPHTWLHSALCIYTPAPHPFRLFQYLCVFATLVCWRFLRQVLSFLVVCIQWQFWVFLVFYAFLATSCSRRDCVLGLNSVYLGPFFSVNQIKDICVLDNVLLPDPFLLCIWLHFIYDISDHRIWNVTGSGQRCYMTHFLLQVIPEPWWPGIPPPHT